MTKQNEQDRKLIEAWLRANDEPIGEAERAELNRMIVDDSNARERLIHLAQEQSWLMWHGGDPDASDPTPQPASSAQRGFSGPNKRRSTHSWALTGAVALSILTVFALSRWSTPKSDVATTTPFNWPLKSSVLKIESGSATLALPKVGYVTLEGPTEFELLDQMHARLKQGRIRVRVTEASGHGFVVEYPDGRVTDLGTEFGLDVPPAKTNQEKTSLVVFDGAVDLQRSVAGKQRAGLGRGERLLRGEGVSFGSSGDLDRVMSVTTGNVATFTPSRSAIEALPESVIRDVSDNLRSSETKKFYEIVPGGFGEDVLAYVDRPAHQWNGITQSGLPRELIGADYVKTFGDDDTRTDVEIRVTIGRPAKLYVFFDASLDPPSWLRTGFRKTKEKIGMDLGPWPEVGHPVESGVGPGNSIDHDFTVWVRTVRKPSVVTLGPNRVKKDPYMYGIAAVALDGPQATTRSEKKADN